MKLDELRVGDNFTGFYLLRNIMMKTSKTGKPYMAASLADRTGSVDAKAWDYPGPISPADEGKVVKVQGVMQEFRGMPQITMEKVRLAQPEEYDSILDDLVPSAPINRDEAYARVEALVDSMADTDFQAVCRAFLSRHGAEFRRYPAAKTVHHGFVGGLLMHTVDMLVLADFLAGKYQGIVNRDLLLAGTLLHDMAKLKEFVVSQLGVVTEYSLPGQLLGHLVMGAEEVAEVCRTLAVPEEKSILLQHLLLSHHGQPEFGAAVVPMCAESELLSLIDTMDSRMEIYREAMEETPEGEFSKRIFALEKRIYHHSVEQG